MSRCPDSVVSKSEEKEASTTPLGWNHKLIQFGKHLRSPASGIQSRVRVLAYITLCPNQFRTHPSKFGATLTQDHTTSTCAVYHFAPTRFHLDNNHPSAFNHTAVNMSSSGHRRKSSAVHGHQRNATLSKAQDDRLTLRHSLRQGQAPVIPERKAKHQPQCLLIEDRGC